MNDISPRTSTGHSKAATLIDENLEKVAVALDRIKQDLKNQYGNGEKPVPFVGGIADRIDLISGRLRTTSGDAVINYAKTRIERNPTMFTVAGAALAAAAVQFAVAAVRRERRRPLQPKAETVSE